MQKSNVKRPLRALLGLVVVGASVLGWRSFAGGQSATTDKPDVARQTARPWTGSVDVFEEPGRDKVLQLPRVYKDLGIKKGSRVADVGAGGGWLSVRLARQVGPRGRVYAEDILPNYISYMKDRAKREKLPQMFTVLGTLTDPKLPTNTLDAVVILNAYHEFDHPLAMLAKIKAAMKPGARIGFVERDTDELRQEAEDAYRQTGKVVRRVDEVPDGNPYTDDHRLALPIVRREAEEAGFKFVSSRRLGEDKYLAVVSKPR